MPASLQAVPAPEANPRSERAYSGFRGRAKTVQGDVSAPIYLSHSVTVCSPSNEAESGGLHQDASRRCERVRRLAPSPQGRPRGGGGDRVDQSLRGKVFIDLTAVVLGDLGAVSRSNLRALDKMLGDWYCNWTGSSNTSPLRQSTGTLRRRIDA